MSSLAKEIGQCIEELESTSQCIEIAHISVAELKDWQARAAALERKVEELRDADYRGQLEEEVAT